MNTDKSSSLANKIKELRKLRDSGDEFSFHWIVKSDLPRLLDCIEIQAEALGEAYYVIKHASVQLKDINSSISKVLNSDAEDLGKVIDKVNALFGDTNA